MVCFPFSLQLNNQFVFCFDFSVPSFTFTPTGIYLHFSPLLCYLSMCLWYYSSFSDITNQPSCSEGFFLNNVINDRYHYLFSEYCAFALWLKVFPICVYIAHTHSTPFHASMPFCSTILSVCTTWALFLHIPRE